MKRGLKLVIVFSILFSLLGCKKEFDSIGLELQNDSQQLNNRFTDTTTLVAYSILEDSIITQNLNNSVLGYVNDPIFGRTQAGFYTQFDLSGTNVTFGDNPQFDSLVLTLQYTGSFGDTTSPLSIKVYEIAEALDASKIYYNHHQTPVQPTNLTAKANYQLYPKPNTRVRMDTSFVKPHIRIRLADNFGIDKFLNNPTLTNNSAFQESFPGLYVIADATTGTGNLVYVSLISSLSGLTLYYKENGTPKKYTFSITTINCKFYNYFDHFNYAQATNDLKNQLLNGNTQLGEKVLYAQGTAGVKTRIKFPNLYNVYHGKNVVFNKAELVITNINEDELLFAVPQKLGLQWVKKNGNIAHLPDDEMYTSESYFGGKYDASTKEYRFRITKYIQQLVQDSLINNNEINLVVNGAGIRANRLTFYGTNPDDFSKRLRLELSYTTY